MALVKLNALHWHLTDSESFSILFESHPELCDIGKYSDEKLYKKNNIQEIIKFAKIRGIQVIPEFDAPAHVGEGWQNTNLVTCFNKQPWINFCAGPPCGQFDVTKEELYKYLDDLYRDINNMFNNPGLMHMGGDEVSFECWRIDNDITNWMKDRGWNVEKEDFIKLWDYFQNRALKIWENLSNSKIILWSSSLTQANNVEEILDKNKYIIHYWGEGKDPDLKNLLEKGYNIIMSNYDRLYLDCGFGSWVDNGHIWCSPYKAWHQIYDNDFRILANGYESQILGGIVCLWSNVNDEFAMDSRIWPRASALAERLWSEPSTTYKEANSRIFLHR